MLKIMFQVGNVMLRESIVIEGKIICHVNFVYKFKLISNHKENTQFYNTQTKYSTYIAQISMKTPMFLVPTNIQVQQTEKKMISLKIWIKNKK